MIANTRTFSIEEPRKVRGYGWEIEWQYFYALCFKPPVSDHDQQLKIPEV
ncbi:MAG: hypothetical protein HZB59_04395 [Ignavibacteriales bacterium]|nr:hypothetical protein [Ignavibacteriales bacterium]